VVRTGAFALALGVGALAAPAPVGTPDGIAPSLPVPAYGSYGWPVSGPVIRGFEPPAGPYAAGHRGIDIASPKGSRVRTAAAGVVAFAGRIAGELHVSIDHPDGVRTSYAFLGSVLVEAGMQVERGAVLGTVGTGHPGVSPDHLHFGARYAGQYIDPMLLLERGSLVGMIHLAPIEEGEARAVP
jgi:murein DD-endopeptidase MepM/ murein hydrolase activator NlpD